MSKLQVLQKGEFTCQKCGYRDRSGEKLSIHNNIILCNICKTFAPNEEDKLKSYLEDKIDWRPLQAFRKYHVNKVQATTLGMQKVHEQGKQISRAPFGYKMLNSELIPDEEKKNSVRDIFKDFLNNISLNKIAKEQNLTVNGIKKILKNHAYVGKVRFSGILTQGKHLPILDYKLFNDVQKKLEEKTINQQTGD
ncbi:MAG: recombinase family protein [Nanoarchaeota archaeon]